MREAAGGRSWEMIGLWGSKSNVRRINVNENPLCSIQTLRLNEEDGTTVKGIA